MKRTVPKHKCFAAVAIVMSFMVFAMPILAQQDELMAGHIAGEQAARASVNGTLWLLAGFFGHVFGVVAAYVHQPSPPAVQLLGKSPEYVAAYTDAYKTTAKKTQANRAWIGCIASTVVSIALGIIIGLANADSDDTYYWDEEEYWY